MRENIKMEIRKEQELNIIKMEINMKDFLKIINLMDMEYFIQLMKEDMKETGKMV